MDIVWPVMFWCSKVGDVAFKCSLYLSSKVLADSLMYSSSYSVPATLEPIYNVALFCYSLFYFWEHQQIFQGVLFFEIHLDTISATDVLVALT